MNLQDLSLTGIRFSAPGSQYPVLASLKMETDGEITINVNHPEAATMLWQLIKEDRLLGLEMNFSVRPVEALEGQTDAVEYKDLAEGDPDA